MTGHTARVANKEIQASFFQSCDLSMKTEIPSFITNRLLQNDQFKGKVGSSGSIAHKWAPAEVQISNFFSCQ